MNIFKLTIFMVMLNIVLLFESNICVAGAINDCLKTEIGDKSGLEFYTDRENLLKAERISRSKSLTSKLKPISGRVKSPVEDKIRTLEIDDKKGKKYLKGTTGAVLYTLEDGTQVVFKPINSKWQTNYRAEVLAYEIERLFGCNIVSIDHGTSFTGTGWSYRSFEERHQEIERFLKSTEGKIIIKNMREKNIKTLEKEVENYIGKKDAKRFIDRLQYILEYTT